MKVNRTSLYFSFGDLTGLPWPLAVSCRRQSKSSDMPIYFSSNIRLWSPALRIFYSLMGRKTCQPNYDKVTGAVVEACAV